MRFPLDARLRDGTSVVLSRAGEADLRPLEELYAMIVHEGTSYPHMRPPDREEFLDYWVRGKSTVVAYQDPGPRQRMVGAFYLKPNWPGRARHVANAGFIVAPESRNKGLGWLLGATMLEYARELGYRSVLFNLVFAENLAARHLWGKLGFRELGRIPQAVYKDDGSYQDALVMFRWLSEG